MNIKDTLERIFNEGPKAEDLFIIFGLVVACLIVAVGTLWSVFAAFAYLVVGIFTLNFLKLICGLLWGCALAFFVAIIIVAISWFDKYCM